MKTGLEQFLKIEKSRFSGHRIGLITNPTSIDRNFASSIDLLHEDKSINLCSLFGPQHGLRGFDTQANMIEWDNYTDETTGLPVFSLYGEHRKPTKEMMDTIDVLVFDIQDVGARYYTYIYSMAYCMQACKESGRTFVVLDRPNPIGGEAIEGPVLQAGFQSFVGLYPISVRHGMTVGEIAHLFNERFQIHCELEVVQMDGWNRSSFYDDTDLPWVMPSPNMPTVDTAFVYPGGCLLEGTNVSEGRGTTRPFELLGAPFIDPRALIRKIDTSLPEYQGATLRPVYFKPVFDKFKDELCGGFQVHVTDRKKFRSFWCYLGLIQKFALEYPEEFSFNAPPYEYEYEKLPFDILAGSDEVRTAILAGESIRDVHEYWHPGLVEFGKTRESYLLYE
jgi:beta-N-acetylhexosaminidase